LPQKQAPKSSKQGELQKPSAKPASLANAGKASPKPQQRQPAVKTKSMITQSKRNNNAGIPKAPPTKGLRFKGPRSGKRDVAATIQQRLKKKSPWFNSILDPLHGADCKIPDETGVETGVTQVVQRATTVTNADGICGLRVASPYIQNAGSEVNFQVINTTSGATSLVWGDGTLSGSTHGFKFDGTDELAAITNQHRIVSAAMYIQPEPDLADNKGEVVCFAQDWNLPSSPNYIDYLNFYKSTVTPVNDNKALVVRWFPVDRTVINGDDANDLISYGFKSFFPTDSELDQATPPWSFGFVTSGCATGVTFRATIVVNYEFIPIFNTLNVLGASPSPVDTVEMDLVETWVQDAPIAQPIGQGQAASSPSTVSPRHEDDQTGFGMFFNVLSELTPLIGMLL